jgi:tetratricopeptide (TPR) repeat protein
LNRALLDYTVAIDNDSHPHYYLHRGICHRTMQKHAKSIADFDAAIDMRPESATMFQLYLNRGLTYYDKGDKQKAIEVITFNMICSFKLGFFQSN